MESERVYRWLEAPAGRAVWFVRAQAEDGHGKDFVDVVWGRTCTWRSVIGVEGAVAHRGMPSLHRIRVGYLLEPGFVAHLRGLTFDDQIESCTGDGDDAVRMLREILAFARGGT